MAWEKLEEMTLTLKFRLRKKRYVIECSKLKSIKLCVILRSIKKP